MKIYNLKDPRTNKTEEVYEYPWDLASPMLRVKGCLLVSRELLKVPILVVPNEYLSEIPLGYVLLDSMYASFELLDYYNSNVVKENKQTEYDNNISKLKTMFGSGTFHLRSCKTMFYTGPKSVYKRIFTNNWIYKENGLSLEDIGQYKVIDSLSLKEINEVFITGTFESNGEVVKNTQCKIVVLVG